MRNCLQLCQSTDHGEDENVEEVIELQNAGNKTENIEIFHQLDSFEEGDTFLATLTSSFVPCVNGTKPCTLIVTGIVRGGVKIEKRENLGQCTNRGGGGKVGQHIAPISSRGITP